MAEPESILQLGIEAARDGNKEEARNLFRLLTRQEPDNAQAWLWLAGVAENREERQGALERVLELEPDNEMALKGLQALGARPALGRAVPPPPIAEPVPPPAPPRRVDDDDPFADDPFAELDALSETMASDTSGPVRRSDTPRYDDEELAAATAAGAAAGAAAGEASARSSRDTLPRPTRPARPSRFDDEDDTEPRRGIPLLAILLALVALGVIGLLIAFFFPDLFGGGQVANRPPAEQTADANATALATTSESGLAPTSGLTDPNATTDPNVTGVPGSGVDPNATAAPGVDPNATAAPGVDPNATAAPAPGTAGQVTDLTQANPAIVPANTPLSSEGWLYDFNQPTYAAPIIGDLGQFTPANGRFVVVLAFIVNNSGTEQPIPGNFFVLKDAQGRVWEARPDVSPAYVLPGVNADLAQTTPVPPDGVTRSVAIIFDVAPDATNLVFFARSNPSQGWQVLQAV